MAIFKCKMCGGTIEFEPGASVGVCDSCGTKQTLPRLDDDRKSDLYDRANHFRRNNEFDKASGIYEQILEADPTDSEAYWSLVLCRYGIEYVEDPATHRRVPTVNRAQFTSIFDDDNYRSALKYADSSQKSIYEAEAAAINEIQKGILAISQKEEPFDIFICYKETDNNGRRTPDSVLANDLYHQLTQEGFKVFFSRITLEDKLGTAYEPYIFAALNSANVMVVLGTRAEYFNAVWVKNEWSRYLTLVKQSGGKKVLIPAYRDMDPYDLPEEFSHLQAQDMSKLGFMQDLIRGIKKIASADRTKTAPAAAQPAPAAPASEAPLLRRAFMFLEDGEWEKADEFCEQVLNMDPENAQAYLGKLMAELHVRKKENLKDCAQPFGASGNYQKAVRFGNEGTAAMLKDCIKFINDRNENARREKIYNNANSQRLSAGKEEDFRSAASLYRSIKGYKDSDALAEQCLEQAETARKDKAYNNALNLMSGMSVSLNEHAINIFKTIPGWKDADVKVAECEKTIERLKAEEQQRIEAARRAAAKRKRVMIILLIAAVICAALALLITQVIIPNSRYNSAVDLMKEGKYTEAIAAFEAMDGYKDSTDKIDECKYGAAVALMDAGEYEQAIAAFKALVEYKDSTDQITEAKYRYAGQLNSEGKYDEAYSLYAAITGYKDVDSIIESDANIRRAQFEVGNTVTFGSYEQDNDTSNGMEAIEWIVLETDGETATLISKYGLDSKPYNEDNVGVTWEKCTLRSWLNSDFYNMAFGAEEQAKIETAYVINSINSKYGTYGGNDTEDKVYLLSLDEANSFFSSDSDRRSQAIGMGEYAGNCWWWLRSPGRNTDFAAYISPAGSIHYDGSAIYNIAGVVRPVIILRLFD